jgi:phytoene/squalene synthetase
MDGQPNTRYALAGAITKAASQQTYYTIRCLVDRERVADAYRAYAYFRWVDDRLDGPDGVGPEKLAFAGRQQALLESCYRGAPPAGLCAEEQMLADLVQQDTEADSGLQIYLRQMMAVMAFDAGRRGQLISQAELAEYSRKLATAVTEAMHYFVGHAEPPPRHPARYLAVTAAHITHMLRDTRDDVAAGYFNVPREYLQARGISARDVESRAYREWVGSRVQLARAYFQAGRECLAQVKNWRCRLAGYAYAARFEWMLRVIERDHYCLRSEYGQRRSLGAGLWMGWSTLASLFGPAWSTAGPRRLATRPVRNEER